MGYVIRQLRGNKKRSWKLQHQSEKDGERKTTDIPNDKYLAIGFRPDMSIEEARRRKDQLNAQDHLMRHETRRTAIQERLKTEKTIQEGFLPVHEREEFENTRLCNRLSQDEVTRNKIKSHWRAAVKILCEVKLEPRHWYDQAGAFYDQFKKEGFSLSYVHKVLPLINRWGMFLAQKHGTPFLPIPTPRGIEKQRIVDRHYDANKDGEISDPIAPNELEAKRVGLDPGHFNWLFLSVWFGLRPNEVDKLSEPSSDVTWWTSKQDGVSILWIYQSKLSSISREKRAKPIPCIRPEQIVGLGLIETKDFKRPLAKTVRAHFGERTTCYAGRKGFTDLMLSLGQELEDISVWMGHQSIERTWKSYKNKQTVRFKKVA